MPSVIRSYIPATLTRACHAISTLPLGAGHAAVRHHCPIHDARAGRVVGWCLHPHRHDRRRSRSVAGGRYVGHGAHAGSTRRADAGWFNAGRLPGTWSTVSNTPPSKDFINPSTPGDRRLVNSDLAFLQNYAIQGNYSGMQIWDVSNPKKPTLAAAYVCPGSQSDVSVYKNLLFVSAEATNGRIDCGLEGVKDTVSTERARGIRIYDISDIQHPKSIKVVQTCRGSHTNTMVTDPHDADNVYIYVSGSAPVRSSEELAGCSGLLPDEDPNSATLPHRGHSGAVGAPRGGTHRELAPHLHRICAP